MPVAPSRSFTRCSGWSLPELVAVTALVALSLHAALPSWQGWHTRLHTRSARDQLMMDLQNAREQARQLARPLQLQALRGCAWQSPTATDWSCGWQLIDTQNQRTLNTTSLNHPLQVTFTKSLPLDISERGDLGQVGDRWKVQARSAPGSTTLAICLSSAGRVRTLEGNACS